MRALAHSGRGAPSAPRQAAARRVIAIGRVAFGAAYGFALLVVALT